MAPCEGTEPHYRLALEVPVLSEKEVVFMLLKVSGYNTRFSSLRRLNSFEP